MWRVVNYAAVVQLVEHLPSKQIVASSSLVSRSKCGYGGMADTMDLGSIAKACRFKSCYPHQRVVDRLDSDKLE